MSEGAPIAPPRLLIGVSPYDARGDAGVRQAEALASLTGLARADAVNVQFRREPYETPSLRTLAILTKTSRGLARSAGPLKPIVAEILDALAADASRVGATHVCYANADIIVTQAAVDRVLDGDPDGCAFSRRDLDAASGGDLGIQLAGVDAFAVGVRWWQANRARFRDYIAGEPAWDNVFAAILLCHAHAGIENREGVICHRAHGAAWGASPFVHYTRLLAARDAPYFSLWCRYVDRLRALRAAGGSIEEERTLAREVFRRQPGTFARAVQAGRSVKAALRYAWVSRRSSTRWPFGAR